MEIRGVGRRGPTGSSIGTKGVQKSCATDPLTWERCGDTLSLLGKEVGLDDEKQTTENVLETCFFTVSHLANSWQRIQKECQKGARFQVFVWRGASTGPKENVNRDCTREKLAEKHFSQS